MLSEAPAKARNGHHRPASLLEEREFGLRHAEVHVPEDIGRTAFWDEIRAVCRVRRGCGHRSEASSPSTPRFRGTRDLDHQALRLIRETERTRMSLSQGYPGKQPSEHSLCPGAPSAAVLCVYLATGSARIDKGSLIN